MKILNLTDGLRFLDSLRSFGVKLGLENIQFLTELLKNPQDELQFIHVAGTNGKGSTCNYLYNALQNCGFSTAFFCSPYLVSFSERWQVNGENISDDDLLECIQSIANCYEILHEQEKHITYFEALTVIALLYFKKKNVDFVVWETGLGGRLDSTNIVQPLLSIITNIDLDHQQWLGETLEEIATEKAGIIKKNVPVICGENRPELISLFAEKAKKSQAEFYHVKRDFEILYNVMNQNDKVNQLTLRLPQNEIVNVTLKEICHEDNVLCAAAALQILKQKYSMSLKDALKGIEQSVWQGRYQRLANGMFLDGAHNLPAIKLLLEKLQQFYGENSYHFIVGILEDKGWEKMLDVMMPYAKSIRFVPVNSGRSTNPEKLLNYCREASVNLETSIEKNAQSAIQNSANPANTVITGSLYLAGEILGMINDAVAASL